MNSYAYDYANRLTSLTGSTMVTYAYNGLGDRLQETVDNDTTTFTMDLNAGLTQALSDGTYTYLYGNGRIAQVDTTAEYFLGDALGSVRQLTDATGAITYARSYDPYGVVAQTSGASQSVYGYTGEYQDPAGLVYLRARHYAPRVGRFLTQDTWKGLSTSPISYNKWIYANDNPIYYLDASGKLPLPLILLLLGLGIFGFGTSGCSTGLEPAVCPELPENLQPKALRVNPPELSLENIKNWFGIQLPPSVKYVDQSGASHSTSYHFVFSEEITVASIKPKAGYTPWFVGGIYGTWGDVIIFRATFQHVGNSAYDIADAMVHEAMHVWQQYTLVQLAQESNSSFAQYEENKMFYTKEWQQEYGMAMEYDASFYVLQHMPNPLCTSKTMHDNEIGNKNSASESQDFKAVPGLSMSPWPLEGYPLP